ncbi:hypothetical protein TrLO_g14492 [Triparma laevis f. longispina]|uniref:Uncharacterized protein n=1 Tax=Triparma laevis f. longispina TaxID=1714387 RepID=A0A9W7AC98_9STRA|nr:hypothetical protein TrLO_g14492 [Triparma laevis f. longispina]
MKHHRILVLTLLLCRQALSFTPRVATRRCISSRVPQTHLKAASPALSASSDPEVDFYEIDFRYGTKNKLVYERRKDQFISQFEEGEDSPSRSLKYVLISSFLPEGVTPDYFTFIKWRLLQRFISANVHVLGTQSLLLGLGIKNRNSLGLSAALNWVLKDCLGKVVRMLWASKMGRKFDSDAKRWRFRASLLYALGNGLEIVTYAFPLFFLFYATLANCLKQISMLTSSSTRNALYNSFREKGRENIGDITAKGEAQISVVDLFGIASGVCLSKFVGGLSERIDMIHFSLSKQTTNDFSNSLLFFCPPLLSVGGEVRNILVTFLVLQGLEIACMYKEIRSVVFKMLNFERLWGMVEGYVGLGDRHSERGLLVGESLPTPQQLSMKERVFKPPRHLCRRAIAFGSLGRAKLTPSELKELLGVFEGEKYLLVVGEDIKNVRRNRQRRRKKNQAVKRQDKLSDAEREEEIYKEIVANAQEDCHIVLHSKATNLDIVKSTIALASLRRQLGDTCAQGLDEICELGLDKRRTDDSMVYIKAAKEEADNKFRGFIEKLGDAGWQNDKFMFGRVSMRNEWRLSEE